MKSMHLYIKSSQEGLHHCYIRTTETRVYSMLKVFSMFQKNVGDKID